jgi:hypothetical protein
MIVRLVRAFAFATALALPFLAVGAGTAHAQVRDSTRVTTVSQAGFTGLSAPPISPKRAFLYSFLLPGFGQSRLDRGTAGALFASVELAAIVMVRRSFADVREVRRFRIDTLPESFTVVDGNFVGTGRVTNRFTRDLERTRRLHVEDWLAVIAFNHLFAGADAFVSAQLWDVPVGFSARPGRDGTYVVATIRW